MSSLPPSASSVVPSAEELAQRQWLQNPYEASGTLMSGFKHHSSHSPEKPTVLILVTGGTICMTHTGSESSLRPAPLAHCLKTYIDDPSLPNYDVLEWEDLIDSSEVDLVHWIRICNEIEQHYTNFDGFVVLHGTDTLAYTASALSFMLENLNKPVVLTGSMLPMHHIQTDARKNLAVALMVAGHSFITEVVVLFGSRLLRGNRTRKLDCSQMDAFKSPNFPPLGRVGVDVTVDDQLLLMPSKRGFRAFRNLCMNVVIVMVTPGFQSSLLRHLFLSPTRPLAVILALYGTGTAPTLGNELIDTVKLGLDNGVEIMCLSQCPYGTCSLLTYENGAMLCRLGVIEGKDITPEAAFVKLAYLMGKGYRGDSLKCLMEQDIRGEVTERPVTVTGQATLSRRAHLNQVPPNCVRPHMLLPNPIRPEKEELPNVSGLVENMDLQPTVCDGNVLVEELEDKSGDSLNSSRAATSSTQKAMLTARTLPPGIIRTGSCNNVQSAAAIVIGPAASDSTPIIPQAVATPVAPQIQSPQSAPVGKRVQSNSEAAGPLRKTKEFDAYSSTSSSSDESVTVPENEQISLLLEKAKNMSRQRRASCSSSKYHPELQATIHHTAEVDLNRQPVFVPDVTADAGAVPGAGTKSRRFRRNHKRNQQRKRHSKAAANADVMDPTSSNPMNLGGLGSPVLAQQLIDLGLLPHLSHQLNASHPLQLRMHEAQLYEQAGLLGLSRGQHPQFFSHQQSPQQIRQLPQLTQQFATLPPQMTDALISGAAVNVPANEPNTNLPNHPL